MPKLNRVVLNDKRIAALKVPDGRPSFDLFDAVVPGLVLRGSKTGRKVFYVWYRDRTTKKVVWLLVKDPHLSTYEYPILGLARARDLARDLLLDTGNGRTPGAAQAAVDAAQVLVQSRTFAALCASFFAEHPLKPASREYYQTKVRQVLGPLAPLPVRDITRDHIRAIIDPMRARGVKPYANRVVGILSSILTFGLKKDWIDTHPMYRKITQSLEPGRPRVLDDAELRQAWQALAAPPADAPAAMVKAWPLLAAWTKLRIVTAKRSSEVLGMKWADLKGLDTKRPVWEINDNKTGRPEIVPLSPLALRIIADVRQAQATRKMGKWAIHDQHAFAGILSTRSRQGMTAHFGIDDLQLRDFRRTTATNLGKLQVLPDYVERVLNHNTGKIAGIYNKWQYEPEKRQALNKWASYLQRIVKVQAQRKRSAA